ncbi:hypothetical protein RND71_041435 [Anisodus tanguticus]|uniref:DUF4283 domain-containing protein n=1 Tax=Anisodus tanguticus TaxID=243964 RepID=A0AAE1QUS1_9SOLA|nr:hypothetical protein RND71_041435 [Anisodus tanguticus]
MVSKSTFAAMVQDELPKLNDGELTTEIKHDTHLGKPVVFFSAQDYFVNFSKVCKFTIIGKFYRGKPTLDEIRKVFDRQFHLLDTVKISYFDPKHVYIDCGNEVDYNHIFLKEYIDIADFKPEEKTSIVPRSGDCCGPKYRGNVVKIKVEIDLLKQRIDQIWLGFKRLDGSDDGKWLDIEYKKVPSYCMYCKM